MELGFGQDSHGLWLVGTSLCPPGQAVGLLSFHHNLLPGTGPCFSLILPTPLIYLWQMTFCPRKKLLLTGFTLLLPMSLNFKNGLRCTDSCVGTCNCTCTHVSFLFDKKHADHITLTKTQMEHFLSHNQVRFWHPLNLRNPMVVKRWAFKAIFHFTSKEKVLKFFARLGNGSEGKKKTSFQ